MPSTRSRGLGDHDSTTASPSAGGTPRGSRKRGERCVGQIPGVSMISKRSLRGRWGKEIRIQAGNPHVLPLSLIAENRHMIRDEQYPFRLEHVQISVGIVSRSVNPRCVWTHIAIEDTDNLIKNESLYSGEILECGTRWWGCQQPGHVEVDVPKYEPRVCVILHRVESAGCDGIYHIALARAGHAYYRLFIPCIDRGISSS